MPTTKLLLSRCAVLLTLAVLALGAARPALADPQTDSITFTSAPGQSIWSPDLPSINYTWAKDFKWDFGSGSVGWPLLNASYAFNGDVGFKFNAYASLGNVTVSYPIAFTITYPPQSQIANGKWFPVTSSYQVTSAANLSTTAPSAGASLNLTFDVNNYARLRSDTFGLTLYDLFGGGPLDSINLSQTVFDTGNVLDPSQFQPIPFDLFDGAISGVIEAPQLGTNHSGTNAGSLEVDAASQSPFLNLQGHMTDVISELFGIPLSDEFSDGFSVSILGAKLNTDATIGYNLLDLRSNLNVDLGQSFTFTPQTPHVYQSFSYPTWFQGPDGRYHYGTTIDYDAGQSYRMLMPPVAETVVTTYTLPHPVFSNSTFIGILPDVEFVPFELYGSAEILSFPLFDFDFKPLDLKLGSSDDNNNPDEAKIPLYSDSFTLDGAWTGIGKTLQLKSVDTSPPVTTLALSGPAGNNGWYTGAVSATLTATDPDGPIDVASTHYSVDTGPVQTYSGPVRISGDGSHNISYYSVDDSGNVEATHVQALKIDGTPPTLAFGTATPAPGTGGWNTTPVSVPFTTADATSGVATATPASPLHFTSQGKNLSKSVTVSDLAGKTKTFTFSGINLDVTPPVTTAAVTGVTTAAGGQVTLAAKDNLSGVAATFYSLDDGPTLTYSAPFTVAPPGPHSVAYWSRDVAGNQATPGSLSFTNTPPVPPPTLSGLSPTSAKSGSGAFTLTVSGGSFVSGAQVLWNGVGLTTTYVSPTTLTASVPASLLTAPATAGVSLVNPDGQSPNGPGQLAFTITP